MADRNETINALLAAYGALRGDIDKQIKANLTAMHENLVRIEKEKKIKQDEIAALEAETSSKPVKDRWRHQVEIQKKTKDLEAVEKKKARMNEEIADFENDLAAFDKLGQELEDLRANIVDLTPIVKKLDGYISRSVDDNKRNNLRAGMGKVIPGFVGATPQLKRDQGLGAIPAGVARRLPVSPGIGGGVTNATGKLNKMRQPGTDVAVDTWGKFFNQTDIAHVKDKIENNHKLALAVQGVTPKQFSDSFKNIPDTLKSYSATAGNKAFRVKSESAEQYKVFKDTDPINPIMEISHVPAEKPSSTNMTPKPSVVNITLTDKSDHSLYLAVVAAKDLLERAGSQSKRFFIENCANDPEKAVKLYIIGKSLGLNPVFRDKPGAVLLIEDSIKASNWTLRLKGETTDLTLQKVYELAQNCAPADQAKELIEKLESKQSPALGMNPAVLPRGVPKNGVALPGLVAPVASPVAAPQPIVGTAPAPVAGRNDILAAIRAAAGRPKRK
jgi:hypothetical protein